MRILGAAVITMESLVMGFALLLAMQNHGAIALSLGGLIALLCILTAGMMKSRRGWIIGSLLQIAIIAYGSVVTTMYFIGGLFAALWIIAFFLGRKGEAIRAQLLAEGEKNPRN
jgi:hypothetical protein